MSRIVTNPELGGAPVTGAGRLVIGLGSVTTVTTVEIVEIVETVLAGQSRGSSGIGPVVWVVGLTIGSALLISFVIGKLPGSDENTGASPFRRRKKDPFGQPPDDPMDQPPRGPFVN